MIFQKTTWLKSALVCTLSCSVLTSCLVEKPDLKDDDGAPVTVAQVTDAINQAWGSFEPEAMGLGEYSYVVKTVKLSSMDPKVTEDHLVQIIDVCHHDVAKGTQYTLVQTVREFDDKGTPTEVSTQRQLFLNDPEASATSAALRSQAVESFRNSLASVGVTGAAFAMPHLMSANVTAQSVGLSFEIGSGLANVCKAREGETVNCFNLVVDEVEEDLPTLLKESSACAGFPNCKWLKKRVAFDFVIEAEDGKGNIQRNKAKYTATFVPAAPFLSRLASYCYSGLTSINGQTYPVEICEQLQDMRARTEAPDPAKTCAP